MRYFIASLVLVFNFNVLAANETQNDLIQREQIKRALELKTKLNYNNAVDNEVFFSVLMETRKISLKASNNLKGATAKDLLRSIVLASFNKLHSQNSLVIKSALEKLEKPDESEAQFIAAYEKYLPHAIVDRASSLLAFKEAKAIIKNKKSLSQNKVKEIFDFTPGYASEFSSEFAGSARAFIFCRNQRKFPCRLIVKDLNGDVVKVDGEVWNKPVLAKSSRGLGSHITNGNTPQGIHLMRSVMPEANRFKDFGKYRRVVLNFVDKSVEDINEKELLPVSAHEDAWWKKANIARDVGRKYLRIHGTGRVSNSSKVYFPHVPSAGCVTTLEGTYNDIEYTDQRDVLDSLMRSLELAQVYENETSIKGLLYVIELDNKEEAVTLEDLSFLFKPEANPETKPEANSEADSETGSEVKPE